MTLPNPPAGWYPDPEIPGAKRYWDGRQWTDHRQSAYSEAGPGGFSYPGYGYPSFWGGPVVWKGQKYGRPPNGSGALANPGTRFAARLLDGLVLLPAFLVLFLVFFAHFVHDITSSFPQTQQGPDGTTTTTSFPSNFFWHFYAGFFVLWVVSGAILIAYETILTVRYGRTLGKMWMHIRPVRIDAQPIGYGTAFVRVIVYWLFSVLSWVGLLDSLWCLWDDGRQCLHDKAASTIVVDD